MDRNGIRRRSRNRLVAGICALGFSLSFGGSVFADPPAAILPPRPTSSTPGTHSPTIIPRAASPEADEPRLVTTSDSDPRTQPTLTTRSGEITGTTPRYNNRNRAFPELSNAWQKVISGDIFGTPSKPTLIQSASSGSEKTPTIANTPTPKVQPAPETVQPVVPAGPSLIPAWRWYGWGAPTPGRNAYAPNGVYPPAGSRWLTDSGATPGAIQRPVVNPFRPAPGDDPPQYVRQPVTDAPEQEVTPAPRVKGPILPPPHLREAKESPKISDPGFVVPDTPKPEVTRKIEEAPINWRPAAGLDKPAVRPVAGEEKEDRRSPTAGPGAMLEGIRAPQPESGVAPTPDPKLILPSEPMSRLPRTPVTRAQVPIKPSGMPAPAGVVGVVRRECDERVVNVEVYRLGADTLKIRVQVRQMSDAVPVLKHLASVRELGPWNVEFEAGVR